MLGVNMKNKKPIIGFIGQGWIGKNYADDFEKRGFEVIRYSIEEPYVNNADKIKQCEIVFIAVPTPTTDKGFDSSRVREAIKKMNKGAIAVIKSTILPGTTEILQKETPEVLIVHSPEFLRKKTAAHDASHPNRNIVGIPSQDSKYKSAAKKIISILPQAPFELICSSREAEIIKYANNNFLYLKVVYANMLYDLSNTLGCNFENIIDGLGADPRIGKSHLKVEDESGGRGAGGVCFIKDFAAFSRFYKKNTNDSLTNNFLDAVEKKNIDILKKSKKDIGILKDVYGSSD